jgi:predicted small lipoprotein YifL
MKKLIQYLLPVYLLCALYACGKKPGLPIEEKLDVKLSAAAVETVPAPSYSFTADIKSKMPVNGVTIKVEVKREDTNADVYNVQASSAFASNNFTISPLPPGQVFCKATVTVTSVTTPGNTWIGSFRLLWK